MSALVIPMASPTLKRSLEDDGMPRNTIDVLAQAAGEPASVRASSPLSEISSVASKAMDPLDTTASPQTQAAKKRKLTPAEKEAARAEKEKMQQEKAAQKAQKEEERRVKLEEKKVKDEEKEEKRRIKEAEKAAKEQERKEKQDKKDAERKAKDEEKAKKERSQMRLTGFFGRPKTSPSPVPSRRGSIASIDEADASNQSPSKPAKSVMFLPFEPPSHSIVAPWNRFRRDGPAMELAREKLDSILKNPTNNQSWQGNTRKRTLDECFQPPVKRRRYIGPISVKSIIASMQNTPDQPIDLTGSTSQSIPPLQLLGKVPIKQFKFREDVRPPYIGTFTRVPQGRSVKSLSRNPFARALPKVNYDYDSEAEWEEPEEGEDLVSEGEESEDDEGDDMEAFLDDEGAENDPRRRQVIDVPPLQTKMHWESGRRTAESDTMAMGDGVLDLKTFRIETFLEESMVSIDPFSSSYWNPAPAASSGSGNPDQASNMAPPRLPLSLIAGAANLPLYTGQSLATDGRNPAVMLKHDLNQASRSSTGSGGAVAHSAKTKPGRPASQPFPPELMEAFKAAVIEDKEMTKVGLVEVLKKKFPSVPKVTLTENLERIAARVGEKQADKQWVLKS